MSTKKFTATITPSIKSLLVSAANTSMPSDNYLKAMILLAGQQVEVECENLHNMRFKATLETLDKGFNEQKKDSPWFVSAEKLEELKELYCNPQKPLSLATKALHLVEDMSYIQAQIGN